MAAFRDAIDAIAPPWLRREVGERFLYPFGLVLDAAAEWLREATRARLPGVSGLPAPPDDALGLIGADRVIVRGFAETSEAYAARLTVAFDSWRRAGSAEGIMRQAAALFAPLDCPMRVVSNSGSSRTWASMAHSGDAVVYALGDAGGWDWDGDAGRWARVWVLVYVPASTWPRTVWGAPLVWGDSAWSWGVGVPPAQAAVLTSVVRSWKAAHTRVESVVLVYEPTWGGPHAAGADYPDGTWATWSHLSGGVQVPTRFAGALYSSPVV